MKLYLASYRVPNLAALTDLIGKEPSSTKVALITNAKDYYAGRAYTVKNNEAKEYFKQLGFDVDLVDLREYSKSADLIKALKSYDLIWVNGGNTFMIRYEMRRSGFEDAIKDLTKEGVVYGGESAGSLVAGNSLRGVEFADDPNFSEGVIWDGLKLIDNFVLPHVGSQVFGDAIDKAKETHKDDKTIIELTDLQALVVNGSEIKVV